MAKATSDTPPMLDTHTFRYQHRKHAPSPQRARTQAANETRFPVHPRHRVHAHTASYKKLPDQCLLLAQPPLSGTIMGKSPANKQETCPYPHRTSTHKRTTRTHITINSLPIDPCHVATTSQKQTQPPTTAEIPYHPHGTGLLITSSPSATLVPLSTRPPRPTAVRRRTTSHTTRSVIPTTRKIHIRPVPNHRGENMYRKQAASYQPTFATHPLRHSTAFSSFTCVPTPFLHLCMYHGGKSHDTQPDVLTNRHAHCILSCIVPNSLLSCHPCLDHCSNRRPNSSSAFVGYF